MAEMQVGRDLDAAVARAIGWRTFEGVYTHKLFAIDLDKMTRSWQPSTSNADALAALIEWRDGGPYRSVTIVSGDARRWEIRLYDGGLPGGTRNRCGRAVCDRLAEAICRAILALEATNAEAH